MTTAENVDKHLDTLSRILLELDWIEYSTDSSVMKKDIADLIECTRDLQLSIKQQKLAMQEFSNFESCQAALTQLEPVRRLHGYCIAKDVTQ